jgi:acetolactate synthase regulatory subunit
MWRVCCRAAPRAHLVRWVAQALRYRGFRACAMSADVLLLFLLLLLLLAQPELRM